MMTYKCYKTEFLSICFPIFLKEPSMPIKLKHYYLNKNQFKTVIRMIFRGYLPFFPRAILENLIILIII